MTRRDDLLIPVHQYLKECRREGTQAQVSELASRLGMSRQHFHVVFVRQVGIAPGTYIRGLQIEFARQQIRVGKPIAIVATELGLTLSAFQKAYKARFGYPPGRNRR